MTTNASPMLRAADGADRIIARVCELVLLVTGIALMGALTANVVARYVLSTGGFDWAEEVPEQLFPWFIMAGVAFAVQTGGHVAVEWLLDKIGRNATRFVLIAGHLLVIATYVYVVMEALKVAEIVAIEKTPVMGLPKTYGYWSIAAGSVLVALSTTAMLVRLILIGPEAMPKPNPAEATS
jgi:TRAP-type transport system small permease protein